jgi:hypothetical protein
VNRVNRRAARTQSVPAFGQQTASLPRYSFDTLVLLIPRDQLRQKGFCILRARFPASLIDACRVAFWPELLNYLETHREEPNRGPHRHFLPMPFEPPCFAPEFFFDPSVLGLVRGALGERIVADQWGCDVPILGSQHQEAHVDYQRPLFAETPELCLPPYMLVVSFGLVPIARAQGPIEIAPGTHLIPREEGLEAVRTGRIGLQPVPLKIGDVLIRHPWALHRGTPNTSITPRALVTIRYVRSWYADNSREVSTVPRRVWESLISEQRRVMRFPVEE